MPEDEQARFLAATFSRTVLKMALEIREKELELAKKIIKALKEEEEITIVKPREKEA